MILRVASVNLSDEQWTEDTIEAWGEFIPIAKNHGATYVSLARDGDRAVAISVWPDLDSLNSVTSSVEYLKMYEKFQKASGIMNDQIEFIFNGDIVI